MFSNLDVAFPTRARSKETITGAYNIGFTVFHLCNNDEIAYMYWFQGKELSPGTVYDIINCTWHNEGRYRI